MKSDRIKLILALSLLVLASGVYWFVGRKPAALSSSVKFLCVATGTVLSIDRDEIPSVLPAKNPKTGQPTMLPCLERDGKVFVDGVYARMLRDPELAKVNKYVDPQTLEVLKSPRQ